MSIADHPHSGSITVEGARKSLGNLTGTRIRVVIIGIALAFLAVGIRLALLGTVTTDTTIEGRARSAITASRPPILDRNGLEMAVDIRVPSLYAEPNKMIDKAEAIAKLRTVLPDLDPAWLKQRFDKDKGFVWIKRELTPQQKQQILDLGIPGLDFLTESKRFYPGRNEASEVLGMVNIDNQGLSGIERHMDETDVALLQKLGLARGRALEPVTLSLDMRVQHAMREVLLDSLSRYKAIAAAGVIVNVHTGEVVALSSLPDYDPNDPSTYTAPWEGKKEQRFNRITLGRYELGSTFKTITFAAALDSGIVNLTDSFDARFGVKFGRFTITDFHGKHRILTMPEVFKYSSNVGTIHIMQTIGKEVFRKFITRMGFDDPLKIELPEKTTSEIPKHFSDVGAATASFGHGLATTPLHMAQAIAALVNGGIFIPATLYPRTEAEATAIGHRVVSPGVSERIRYLLRLNALEGSGTHAYRLSKGYRIGGKTGTAEKVIDGRYSKTKSLNVFASAFPIENPRYAMVIIVDEPQPENDHSGNTAGWNAGEVSGRIVERVAPMLGIAPEFDTSIDENLVPPELRGHPN